MISVTNTKETCFSHFHQWPLNQQGSQLALCRAEITHLISSLICCLSETFRWDLKWDVLFETFETFQTYHGGLLIWNFQMRLEMRCAMWNFWNLKLFNPSQELLIWNFQIIFEMRYAIWNIWNVWNLKLFKHVMGVACFKLSDETWEKMWYSKHLKLETFQTFQIHQRGCLFETFRWDLKWDFAFWNFLKLCIWNFLNLKLWSVF